MMLNEFIEKYVGAGESKLILIAGRPAMGKTAFVNSIVLESVKKSRHIAYVSLENNGEEWKQRMIKNGVNGDLLCCFDAECQSIADIDKKITEKYDLVVIDYLQLIDRGNEGVLDVQKQLKEVSKKWACPVIVTSQLSRSVEERKNCIPVPEDLESSSLSLELYDEIGLIYREHYYNNEADPTDFRVVTSTVTEHLRWNNESHMVV